MRTDPETLRYQRPSIRARVIAALREGPASERTLCALVGAELHAVSVCLKSLREDRLVRRLGAHGQRCNAPHARGQLYALTSALDACQPIAALHDTS